MNTTIPSLGVLACLALSSTASAQDVFVPGDYATISDALRFGTDLDMDGVLHVKVDPGTFNESLLIQRSDVKLEGSGASMTTIQGDLGARAVYVQGVVNFEMFGFTVLGDPTRDGIEATGCLMVSLHDNTVSGTEDGIRINRSSDVLVFSNTVDQNLSSGIKIKGGTNIAVTGNLCTSNVSTGVDLDRTGGCMVSMNTCMMNSSNGVRVRRSSQVTVENNVCTGNLDNGMLYRDMTQLTVRANTCTGNLANGMRIRDISGTLFTDNVLTGNGEWGVRRRDTFGNDWDEAQAGDQPAPGSNDVSGNTLGTIRTD